MTFFSFLHSVYFRRVATWNDLEFPKTIQHVCSDQYRISKVSCRFEGEDLESRELLALQLEYTCIDDETDVVVGALVGIKSRLTPWTQQFSLEPQEHLTGISILAECKDINLKTSTGRVRSQSFVLV